MERRTANHVHSLARPFMLNFEQSRAAVVRESTYETKLKCLTRIRIVLAACHSLAKQRDNSRADGFPSERFTKAVHFLLPV